MVVVVLSKAGDQLPVTPLSEVVGKALNASPAQIAAMGLNVGTVPALTLTITSSVIVFPQEFVADNVNVIVPVADAGKV